MNNSTKGAIPAQSLVSCSSNESSTNNFDQSENSIALHDEVVKEEMDIGEVEQNSEEPLLSECETSDSNKSNDDPLSEIIKNGNYVDGAVKEELPENENTRHTSTKITRRKRKKASINVRKKDKRRRLKCNICGDNRYFSVAKLLEHQTPQDGETRFTCNICNALFATDCFLQQHAKVHRCCPSCGKAFDDHIQMMIHWRSTHNGEKLFKCTQCDESFISNHVLRKHVRHTHKEGNINGLSKSQKSTEAIVYTCSICNRRYRKNYELIVHQRTHSGEKPFQCNQCRHAFISYPLLRMHVRKQHELSDSNRIGQMHSCPTCSKKYRYNAQLVIHQRSHTGERPFECPHCKKAFVTKAFLTRHTKTYCAAAKDGDAGPFPCELCGKEFPKKAFKTGHLRFGHSMAALEEFLSGLNQDIVGLALEESGTTFLMPDYVSCRVCGISCSSQRALTEHEKQHYSSHDLNSCKGCNQVFSNEAEFTQHLNICRKNERLAYTPDEANAPAPYHPSSSTTLLGEANMDSYLTDSPSHSRQETVIQQIAELNQATLVDSFNNSSLLSWGDNDDILSESGDKGPLWDSIISSSPDEDDMDSSPDEVERSSLAQPGLNDNDGNHILSDSESDSNTRILSGKTWTCTECNEELPTEALLTKHMKKVHKEVQPQRCEVCNQNFISPAIRTKHMLLHPPNSLQMLLNGMNTQITGKLISQQQNDQSQIQKNRPIKKKGKYQCQVCGDQHDELEVFVQHESSHFKGRSYLCKVCGRSFAIPIERASHEMACQQQNLLRPEDLQKSPENSSEQNNVFDADIWTIMNPVSTSPCTITLPVPSDTESNDELADLNESDPMWDPQPISPSLGPFEIVQVGTTEKLNPKRGAYSCPLLSSSTLKDDQVCSGNSMEAMRQRVPRRARSAETFYCGVCSAEKYSKETLMKHLSYHDFKRPFACGICSKRYVTENGKVQHTLRHSREELLENMAHSSSTGVVIGSTSPPEDIFPPSPTSNNDREDYEADEEVSAIMETASTLNQVLGECEREIKDDTEMNEEIQDEQDPLKCSICHAAFKTLRGVFTHKRMKHGVRKTFTCQYCSKNYLKANVLAKHEIMCTMKQQPESKASASDDEDSYSSTSSQASSSSPSSSSDED